MTMKNNEDILLEARDICKFYGPVQALKDIDFQIGSNELIGLLGDNGAGKSSFIKILTGVYPQSSGDLFWKGKKLQNFNAKKARELGITTVFQDKALAGQHSVWRNIFMGREKTDKLGFLKIKELKKETHRLMKEQMRFTSKAVNSDTVVGTMSGGEQQGVAISRSLYFDSELIILDEPTTGLSLTETHKVLDFIQSIKTKNKSAIYISHNLFHVYPIVDRIVVFDRGSIFCDIKKDEVSLNELEDRMKHVALNGESCPD